MRLDGGLLRLHNMTPFSVLDGVFIGVAGLLDLRDSCLVSSVVNAGTLSVGGGEAGNDYTIDGNYTQLSTGTLALQADGSTHDVLRISGYSQLDGTFTLTALNGWVPSPWTTLQLIQFQGGQGGIFSSVLLPDLPPDCWWVIGYGGFFTVTVEGGMGM